MDLFARRALRRAGTAVLAAGLAACAAPPAAAPAARPDATAGQVEPLLVDRPDATFDGSLTLASAFPTLGRYAVSGVQSHRGARLAVDELNRRGGLHGRRLRLLEYHTGSYFVDARHAAELAARDGALAIVGSNSSSLSRAIAEVAESEHLVQVSNVSTATDLTWDPATGADRPFVFRACSSDEELTRHLADFARAHLGARRVAVLYEVGRSYSAQMARRFVGSFADPAAGRVAKELVYLPLETDFRPQLRAAQAFRPDLLFVPGSFTDTSLIATQARTLGFDVTLLGGDGWSNRQLFARGGPRRVSYHVDLCAPAQDFAAAYRAAWGEEADGCRAVLAHDAVLAIASALESLGPLSDAQLRAGLGHTRERLRLALREVDLRGAAGPLRFDARGNVRRRVPVLRIDPLPQGGYAPRLELFMGEG